MEVGDFKTSVLNSGKNFFKHHDCGICKCPVGFRIGDDGNVYFDSSCDCGSNSAPQPRSWEELEEWVSKYPNGI